MTFGKPAPRHSMAESFYPNTNSQIYDAEHQSNSTEMRSAGKIDSLASSYFLPLLNTLKKELQFNCCAFYC
jgi:hypothetical protein